VFGNNASCFKVLTGSENFFSFNEETGFLYLIPFIYLLDIMALRTQDLIRLQSIEIENVADIQPNTITSFIGIILTRENSSLIVQFNKHQLSLHETTNQVFSYGSLGRFFAVFNTTDEGEFLAFTPISVEQMQKYQKIKKLERIYNEKT